MRGHLPLPAVSLSRAAAMAPSAQARESLIASALGLLTPREIHDALSPRERLALRYCWPAHRRPLFRRDDGTWGGQAAPPGQWVVWLVSAGRGFGKTRLGAEWIRDRAMRFPGTRWAIVGETADEARKVMLKGESGLLSVCAPWEKPHFNFTDQSLEFPNGSSVYLYSAEKPEKFRGPQFHGAWLDEFPKWRRMREAWDHIRFGVRLPLRGDRPRVVITTTPRPNKLLREIRARASTVITTGSTYENQANLDQSFLDELENWKGSKLGQQEIYGIQYDEAPGAIFLASWIEKARVKEAPRMRRIVVAVDPTSSDTDRSDETGIVVAGLGEDGRGYVLEDASIRCTPDRWARRAVDAYKHWGADCIVAETTMGGDLVPSMIKLVDSRVPVKIKGGNRGKVSRAEPVAALYEQGKVSHVNGFDELENQMVNYVLGARESPDRMDAMVYAVSELLLPKDVPLVFR
jgi:phage terminase large subunit-like protein